MGARSYLVDGLGGEDERDDINEGEEDCNHNQHLIRLRTRLGLGLGTVIGLGLGLALGPQGEA